MSKKVKNRNSMLTEKILNKLEEQYNIDHSNILDIEILTELIEDVKKYEKKKYLQSLGIILTISTWISLAGSSLLMGRYATSLKDTYAGIVGGLFIIFGGAIGISKILAAQKPLIECGTENIGNAFDQCINENGTKWCELTSLEKENFIKLVKELLEIKQKTKSLVYIQK